MSFLAYYLHNLSPFILRFGGGFGLRWYGFAYVLAFICGYFLYLRLVRRGYSEMKPDQVADFITWGAIFGVLVGGRIGYIVFYDFHAFLRDPLMLFRVWDGGMSSHGGMLGLILFTFWYARRHKLSWTGIGDNLCVVAPVGLFFGRLANFINGELYGRETTVPWAVQFPKELSDNARLADRVFDRITEVDPTLTSVDAAIQAARHDTHIQAVFRELLPPRHPSQLYEAFLEGVVLFTLLWLIRTRCRVPRGVLTGLFFIFYALLRIIGEIYRVPDPAWAVGKWSAGQFLSLYLILIGAAFVVFGLRTRVYEPADRQKKADA